GRDGAAHADHAGQRLARRNLRRVETMMARGRAEVPHPGLTVPGQETPARQLVARPLADDGAREIANVVLVEHQERAECRVLKRRARATQRIGVQAAEVDALLEVDLGVTGRLERTIPAMAGVHVAVGHGPGTGRVLLAGHGGPPLSSLHKRTPAGGGPRPPPARPPPTLAPPRA